MPRNDDYIEMLTNILKGKRSSVEAAELDLLCTFMYNYSGREVAGAMRGTFFPLFAQSQVREDTSQINLTRVAKADLRIDLHMSMLTDLMASSSFAPVDEDGEVCSQYRRNKNGI